MTLNFKNINIRGLASKGVPIGIYVFLFFLPGLQKIALIGLFASIVLSLVNLNFKEIFSNVFKNKILLLPVLFYLMHVVGLIYSKNLSFALFDLEVKAGLILLPFLFAGINFTGSNFRNFFNSFISGNIIAVLYCLILSFLKYFQSGLSYVFFYEEFSNFLHPSYFAMYLSFSIILVLNNIFELRNKRFLEVIYFMVLFLFFIAIALLTSRSGILVTFFVIILFSIYKIYYQREFRREYILRGVILLFLFGSSLFTLKFYDRFSQLENEIKAINEYSAKGNYSNPEDISPTRTQIWINSLQLIKEHPVLGVGTGDIRDELNKIFNRDNICFLNAHNQYLQTTATLGFIGLIGLLFLFLFPLIFFIKSRYAVPALFLIIILLNSLTESILERQAGILFFIFFYIILYLEASRENNQVRNSGKLK